MVARRSIVKYGVRRISRWPSPLDILFYNNREPSHLQSDREPKHYKKVRWSYANITPIFSALLCAFWYIFRHNSCVCGYNILVHGRSLDNNILFHLVLISNSSTAIYWSARSDFAPKVSYFYDMFTAFSYTISDQFLILKTLEKGSNYQYILQKWSNIISLLQKCKLFFGIDCVRHLVIILGFFVVFFCFWYLILHGDPLSQRLLFQGPTESLQIHTHKQSQQSSHIHTHCVVGGSTFFSSHSGVQGWVWTQNIP